MNRSLSMLGALVLLCGAGGADAQTAGFTAGAYVTPDGLYTIQVETDGTNLTVVEPNKTSVYAPAGPGVYHFINPTNGVAYGLRVLDARTLESFKPGHSAPPTRLTLREEPVPGAVSEDEEERFFAMAMRYQERAQTDPDNAHVWTACSGAAMTRSTLAEDGAREYTLQLVRMLKPIMVDAAHTPCEDAIPDALWRSVP